MVALKQLILILLAYVISFVPLVLILNVPGTSAWIVYLMYIRQPRRQLLHLPGREHGVENNLRVLVQFGGSPPKYSYESSGAVWGVTPQIPMRVLVQFEG